MFLYSEGYLNKDKNITFGWIIVSKDKALNFATKQRQSPFTVDVC